MSRGRPACAPLAGWPRTNRKETSPLDLTVTVTWMDGSQETYRCYDTKVSDGYLRLTPRMHSSQPTRCIPLASIRTWTVEDRR